MQYFYTILSAVVLSVVHAKIAFLFLCWESFWQGLLGNSGIRFDLNYSVINKINWIKYLARAKVWNWETIHFFLQILIHWLVKECHIYRSLLFFWNLDSALVQTYKSLRFICLPLFFITIIRFLSIKFRLPLVILIVM